MGPLDKHEGSRLNSHGIAVNQEQIVLVYCIEELDMFTLSSALTA